MQEAELESMQAAVQALSQENEMLRATSTEVGGNADSSAGSSRLAPSNAETCTALCTFQAMVMLQEEGQALREALKASEAEVLRLHAQRVAEVAVTRAALRAQVGCMSAAGW